MFYFEKINNKKILKSTLLKELPHAFTTRESVIKSAEPFTTNLIAENKAAICKYFNISQSELICPEQTHSCNISLVLDDKYSYPQTDALILTTYSKAIYLNFADCTPIILFDNKLNIGAIVHAGWRGTAQSITAKTVNTLIQSFGSNPKNICAAIGPAIDQCCYQVGKDVQKALEKTISNSKNCFKEQNTKIYANLKKINYYQLLSTGVEKIDLCNYCTSCSNELFFSYRKENGTTSRHSAIIKLNKER